MNKYKKHITFWLIISSLFSVIIACEEIYNPHIKDVDNYLVVEAKLYSHQQQNYIRLYWTKNFDSPGDYDKVTGAAVTLTDDKGEIIYANETDTAGTYRIDYLLDQNRTYSLSVKTDGEEYISNPQPVPEVPSLDLVYAAYTKYVYTLGTSNSSDNIITKYGFRVYADISNKGLQNYYRFDGRMVLQYLLNGTATFSYVWNSYYPVGLFNIAGPADYSSQNNINKHQLEFFSNNYWDYLDIHYAELVDSALFTGWIYIIDEYGLNEDTYNYYSELNNQLSANGKIFDPVYAQTKGNIKCSSNPDILVLGNFEISSHNEYRYFLDYNLSGKLFTLKKIPYFYDIPKEGKVIYYYASGTISGNGNFPPDFWESLDKTYPDNE